MGQEDDLRGMGKVIYLLRAVSIILLVLNVYVFCFEWFANAGYTHTIASKVLRSICDTGLFDHTLYSKLGSLALLAGSCLGVKAKKSETASWKQAGVVTGIGVLLFFFNDMVSLPEPTTSNLIVYSGTMLVGYTAIFTGIIWITKLLNVNLMKDVFNVENESFMQEIKLMENDSSINLRTKFYYNKKEHNGWINVVNPYRATTMLGTPGSGKSYAIINSYIKQQIEKGFSLYCYDFKYV